MHAYTFRNIHVYAYHATKTIFKLFAFGERLLPFLWIQSEIEIFSVNARFSNVFKFNFLKRDPMNK